MKFKEAVLMKNNWLLRKEIWTDYFIVRASFSFLIDYNNKKWAKVIVPKWFRTDFGSIPFFLRGLFNHSKYVAYILHDYLYSTQIVSRMTADRLLREWLKWEWMSFIWRMLVYLWVRIWWIFYYWK